MTLKRPILIEPFDQTNSGNIATFQFTTNLNEVNVKFKLSLNTFKVMALYPGSNIPEDITNLLDFYTQESDGSLTPITIGSGTNQFTFPLSQEIIGSFDLELTPLVLNSLTLRVHNGDYDYSKLPSEYPNTIIDTEELSLGIQHSTIDSTGISIDPPTRLFTDYKNDAVKLYFADNNFIESAPLGSGYKVYYSLEDKNRVNSYKALNSNLVTDYTLEDSYKKVEEEFISKELVTETSDFESLDTVLDYEKPSDVIYNDDFYYRQFNSDININLDYVFNINGNVATLVSPLNTLNLESVGALLYEQVTDSYVNVEGWVSNTSITLSGNSIPQGNNITLSIVGNRRKELFSNYVRLQALTKLTAINTNLNTLRSSIQLSIPPTLVGTNIILLDQLKSTLFEFEGKQIILSNGVDSQVVEIEKWIADYSITISENTSHNYDRILVTYSDISPLVNEVYSSKVVEFFNYSILNSFNSWFLQPNIADIYFDLNILCWKFKSNTSLYTLGIVNLEVYRNIDSASLILFNYPQYLTSYTFGVLNDSYINSVSDVSTNYYILDQRVSDNSVLPVPLRTEYGFYEKVFISYSPELEGSILSQSVFAKFPIYNKVYVRTIEVDVQTIIARNEFTNLLNINVMNSNLLDNDSLPSDGNIYFTVSFIYKDPVRRILLESGKSKETFGSIVPSDYQNFTPQTPSSEDVQRQLISEINSTDPDIDLKPGTVSRSVFVNPLSSVIENLSFREYFREISQSFVTLLNFDGLDENGNSIKVEDSVEKLKLRDSFGLDATESSNQQLQDYIDSRFDILASNLNVYRNIGSYARGEITLKVANLPDNSEALILPQRSVVSTESPVLTFYTLNSVKRSSFSQVKDQNGFYTARVSIVASQLGSNYLLPSNSITKVQGSSISGLTVTNFAPTYGGKDSQTNLELVNSVKRKLLSVDTGTLNGYLYKLSQLGSIERVKIVKSGDFYMRRDFDSISGVKGYNAVDVYIKGNNPVTLTQRSGVTNNGTIYVEASLTDDILNFGTNQSFYVFDLLINNPELPLDNFDIFEIKSFLVPKLDSLSYDYSNLNLDRLIIFDRFKFALFYQDASSFLSELQNTLTLGDKIFVEVSFRKSQDIPYETKPVISNLSLNDTDGNVLESGVNYITYNNSRTLYEKGSILEDSGVRTLISPLNTIDTVTFSAVDSIDNQILYIPDCYYQPRPYIEDLSNSNLVWYLDYDFSIKEAGDYFYIKIDSTLNNFSGTIIEGQQYKLKYGPYLDKYKIFTAIYDSDILIDIKSYSKYLNMSYDSLGKVLREIPTDLDLPSYIKDQTAIDTAYTLFKGNGLKTVLILLRDTFANNNNDTITVNYYKNFDFFTVKNFNQPSFSDPLSDYGVNLDIDIEYPLSHKGVDASTIIVRPTSNFEVDLTPFEIGVDYNIRQSGDSTYIRRLASGNIQETQKVDIEYFYTNEMSIKYSFDNQVSQVTDELETFSHAGSNFLVKNINYANVSIKAIVYINNSNFQSKIDTDIRRDLYRYVNQLDVGSSLYESDVIGIIEQVSGVRNTKVKLSSMSLSAGEISYFEQIPFGKFILYQTGYVTVYRTESAYYTSNGTFVSSLRNTPKEAGGTIDNERAFIVNNQYYTIVDSIIEVTEDVGRAYISKDGSVYASFYSNVTDESLIEVTYQVDSSRLAQDIIVYPFQSINISSLDLVFKVG